MADPVPLYASDLATLLASVRIDNASADTLNAVYRAVRDVRIGMVQKLGRVRVFEIQALPYVSEPTTDDEFLREAAVSAETTWLLLLLKQRLPELFMDNSGAVNDVFNDEPLTREGTGSKDNLEALKEQLDSLLAFMAGEDVDVLGRDKASLCGPDEGYVIDDNRIGTPCH